jgi:hypothetical protein
MGLLSLATIDGSESQHEKNPFYNRKVWHWLGLCPWRHHLNWLNISKNLDVSLDQNQNNTVAIELSTEQGVITEGANWCGGIRSVMCCEVSEVLRYEPCLGLRGNAV